MIKKILLILVLLAVAGVAAIYFFGSSALNSGIKNGVETYGPRVTQTTVRLDAVNLSVLSGNGKLTGLYIGNPEGYQSENIFALGEIEVEIDKGTVFSDKIVINKIIINKPEMSYEKKLMGSNVKDLLKNIEDFTGGSSETAPSEETATESDGASKKVVIKQLVIDECTVYVGALGVGQTVTLPRIEMTDIGEGDQSVTLAQATNLILTQVLANIGPAIAESGISTESTTKALGDAAGDAVNKASESIKGLFNK
ncbi:hypothetical protein [Coraliomargarita parva]|uniref:hypothetical protein n=1 Tax=Coraliomargarita parva TaxID=3014050 RepID=UPI0022B43D0C|nr:hypothetical protein [Coraliomargarita parva]